MSDAHERDAGKNRAYCSCVLLKCLIGQKVLKVSHAVKLMLLLYSKTSNKSQCNSGSRTFWTRTELWKDHHGDGHHEHINVIITVKVSAQINAD